MKNRPSTHEASMEPSIRGRELRAIMLPLWAAQWVNNQPPQPFVVTSKISLNVFELEIVSHSFCKSSKPFDKDRLYEMGNENCDQLAGKIKVNFISSEKHLGGEIQIKINSLFKKIGLPRGG